MYYSETYKSPMSAYTVKRVFGVDPENDAATALSIGVYPITPHDTAYSTAYYREETNSTYTAVPNCVTVLEQEMVQTIRSVQANLSTLRTALGLPATQEVPQAISGYFPLYVSEAESDAASSNNESHEHELNGVTYYMPDAGVTLYHGTYEY